MPEPNRPDNRPDWDMTPYLTQACEGCGGMQFIQWGHGFERCNNVSCSRVRYTQYFHDLLWSKGIHPIQRQQAKMNDYTNVVQFPGKGRKKGGT
jgi:hypothetical protein